jgi:hypothetical protein
VELRAGVVPGGAEQGVGPLSAVASPRRQPAPGRFAGILRETEELPDAPYRGISSYRLLDSGLLFARDEQIERLVQLILVYRAALVFGESGVGKTSMLNAGFVPEALRLGYLPERVRLRCGTDAPILIEHIGLETSASGATLPSNFGLERTGARSVAFTLEDFRARLRALKPEHGALLVFDQFEELVTLFEDAPAPDALQDALALQASLFDLIVEALTSPRIAAKFVFSMRQDYLGRMARLLGRVPDLRERFVHIEPLKGEDLAAIVRGPIEKYPHAYQERMPQAAQDQVIRQFTSRVGAGPVNLSEVQIVARRVWDHPADRERLAQEGIGAVIDAYFSEEFTRSTPEEQADIRALMSCMVTSGGTRNWVSADDLLGRVAQDTGAPRARLEGLMRHLDREGRRLVTSEERQNVVYYTILSEFLVPRIRRWQEEQRIALERARQRRRVRNLSLVGLVVAVIVAGALFSLNHEREIRARVERQQARADSLSSLLAGSDSLISRARAESQRAESIVTSLGRASDSLARAASQGTARERQLAEQLTKTQAELRRVIQLTDSSRNSSSSASTALARENQLLRGQLNDAAEIGAQLRREAEQMRSQDGKRAAYLGHLGEQLEALSPRASRKAAY